MVDIVDRAARHGAHQGTGRRPHTVEHLGGGITAVYGNGDTAAVDQPDEPAHIGRVATTVGIDRASGIGVRQTGAVGQRTGDAADIGRSVAGQNRGCIRSDLGQGHAGARTHNATDIGHNKARGVTPDIDV